MKKVSLISIVLAFTSITFGLPSGIFVGGSFGGAFNLVGTDYGEIKSNIKIDQTKNSQRVESTLEQSYSKGREPFIDPIIGIRSGIIFSFNERNSLRASVNFDYMPFTLKAENPKVYKKLFQAGVGVDYLLAFDNENSWGALFGSGFDFSFGEFAKYFNDQKNPLLKKNLHLPYAQIGLYKGFANSSQILELGLKIPFGEYVRYSGDEKNSLTILGEKITGAYSAGTGFIGYLRYSYRFNFPILKY